jgi:mannan endo-1,4-beta-mannosidase
VKQIFIGFLLSFSSIMLMAQLSPIQVKDGQFIRNGKPYYFVGANLWYGMNLASIKMGGDRARLLRELDSLQALGINNLRIMAASEGPDTEPYRIRPALQPRPGELEEDLLQGLDFLLVEMSKREMYAVLCLNNFFQWSGGMSQYVSWATGKPIPYPDVNGKDWDDFQHFSARFFANKKAQRLFRQFLVQIINRQNSLSGIPYKDDPVIMSWQLANEPRGFKYVKSYRKWVAKTSHFIKKQDPDALVSLGGEGKLPYESIGTAFEQVSELPGLDYLTMHLWVENWGWYNPRQPDTYDDAMQKAMAYLDDHVSIATRLRKPLVLEEFGISRDGGEHHPTGATLKRDQYYRTILDYLFHKAAGGAAVGGSNFWSWSGEGKPLQPEALWQEGHPFTGDPPHEKQGWYSIYFEDKSTLQVIGEFVRKMSNL